MRITDLLKRSAIAVNVNVDDKSAAIERLIALHEKSGNINDVAAFREGIYKREESGTTAVGCEIAVPHTKSEAVNTPALAAITVPNGVDWDSPDGAPCKLLFMIASTTEDDVHIEVLARLMQLLMDEETTARLKAAKAADEFLGIIEEKENEKFPDEIKPDTSEKTGYRVLAVTACPTGIAHTYMAAEALEKAGKKLGISIKVETNGSGGVKNALTEEEIADCEGIIIAADKSVETARFDGKPVYSTKVADGIHKPEELINIIINGKASVYHSDKKAAASDKSKEKESTGRKIYKHLMNGVSHMLPFVVAGGIFIAIAFLIDTIAGYGASGSSDFGTITPAAAFFKTIGNYSFNLMVPILSGYIARSIADRPGLLVGLAGGFLATSGSTFMLPGGDVPSGFLGGLLAGFAGGYMMLGIEKLCSRLPQSLEGIKPVLIYPLLGLGGIAVIMCAVNPIMGLINTGMTNTLTAMSQIEGLIIPLCSMLAAMMAIDMGGPFNKAAYVFASLGLAAGTEASYIIMASVMIGGMIPPIAIALSTTFFKNRWTGEERKNATVNYIMGLSFITEGAIPYAAGHPLQVIPSCMIGSAVGGALSALFGCQLMAPHGGIFVVATIVNPLMYLAALAAGAAAGMLLLAILKKPINK